jgi:murein DD-endopeptidase MepM/ murein hydrolase activator NlpD
MRPSPRSRGRAKRALAAAVLAGAGLLFVALAVLAVRHFTARSSGPVPSPAAETAGTPPAGPPAPPPPPPLQVERLLISKGTSLPRLLKGHGFSDKEIHRLEESVKPVYNLARIAAGREMRLFRTAEGAWKMLEYDIDEARYLDVRNEEDGVKAEVKAYPFEFRPALVYGVIETTPVAAMARIGEEDVLAYDLAERCFGWDIDFYTDLRKGDTFRILVEKKTLDGKFAGYRNILAAEFVNEGKIFQAYRFTYPDSGDADYFDESGLSKRKEFLKSPFRYGAHVTSRFSASRLHPIYKVYRPHLGVDYGAPEGTQVQATADGKVTFAGWNDGSGRMLKLQHKNGYETLYSHLSGFGPGVRPGAQVKSGDVVGYVGSTGDATGPHLDYRVHYHGVPINPLGQKFKPADPVRKEFKDAYEKEVVRLRGILDAPKALQYAWPRFSF